MDHLTRRLNPDKDSLPLYDESENNNTNVRLIPNRHREDSGASTSSSSAFISISSSISKIRLKQLITYAVIWLVVLLYYERYQVRSTIGSCSWGDDDEKDSQSYHLSLIADPQLVDDYSYPGRPSIINYFTKKLTDNYLHRNYMYHKSLLNPDGIIFLGDLFDGGREWTDPVWYEEYARFNKVYPKFPDTKTIMSLPGNHDIGFGNDVNITKLNRFKTYFGESNDYVIMGGFAVVMVDTISLSSNDPIVKSEAFNFIKQLSNPDHEIKKYPTILLTHVPLYRFTDKQHCGPLRESKNPFPVQKGKQYQTVLEYDLSQELLQSIQPTVIFSGDDHDYCDVTHSYMQNGENKQAREITIKSVALSSGIKYPAMQLLSLNSGTKTYETEICYMPTPSSSLRSYIILIVFQVASFVLSFMFPEKVTIFESRFKRFVKRQQQQKEVLPMAAAAIGDEKKNLKPKVLSNDRLISSVLNFISWTDNIPEERSYPDCIINVIVLLITIWSIMTWFFNHV